MTLISLPHRPLKAAVSNQQGAACRPAQTPSGREQAWPVCLAPPPAFFFFFPFFFLPNRFSQSVGRGSVAAGRIRNSGIHSMLSESPSGKTENFRHSGKQGQMLRSLTLGWYRKKNDLTLLSEAPGGGGAANEREITGNNEGKKRICSYMIRIFKEDGEETAHCQKCQRELSVFVAV